MQWWEYLIIVLVVGFVISVFVLQFILKKKGKSLDGCCSNCKACNGNCASCNGNCKKILKEYHELTK